jgi:hypothetical protein
MLRARIINECNAAQAETYDLCRAFISRAPWCIAAAIRDVAILVVPSVHPPRL